MYSFPNLEPVHFSLLLLDLHIDFSGGRLNIQIWTYQTTVPASWEICMFTCITSLVIPLQMDIYIASMLWILKIVLQWTLWCMYLFELWFSLGIFKGVYCWVLLLLFFVFWGSSILFSIVGILIYIPTNSVGEFRIIHILFSFHLYIFWWWPFLL